VRTAEPGEAARFRVLFEANWAAVERYARRRVDEAVAADVAADVFAVAWRRLDEVPRDPVPWLYGVARRVIANQRRSSERSSRLVDRIGTALVAERGAGALRVDPAQTVATSMTFAKAFDQLSEPDREVLALVVWEGLDARRAAAALGCGVAALSMRLTRARRRLQALLSEEER
jgi:RNA polymerase sigma-70 factor, ECF subfamily